MVTRGVSSGRQMLAIYQMGPLGFGLLWPDVIKLVTGDLQAGKLLLYNQKFSKRVLAFSGMPESRMF